jgi:hypothetical protein
VLRLGRNIFVIATECEAIQGPEPRVDRRVAMARPEGRASFDALWLLAMTSRSRCRLLQQQAFVRITGV